MRPIELTLSAFGPYAGTTTLSFDALGTQRLFVITGPTGSGKTTIFEAILYALYGKLSKRGMDPASLRCDFLKPTDDTVTFVDLILAARPIRSIASRSSVWRKSAGKAREKLARRRCSNAWGTRPSCL